MLILIDILQIFQKIPQQEKEEQQKLKLSIVGINNEIITEEAEESSSESIDIKKIEEEAVNEQDLVQSEILKKEQRELESQMLQQSSQI